MFLELGLRIFGVFGADVVVAAGEAFRRPVRAHFPAPAAVTRGGARLASRGSHTSLVRSLTHGPALSSVPSFTLVTGRNPMDVAPYVLFCVGCHFHGLIEG